MALSELVSRRTRLDRQFDQRTAASVFGTIRDAMRDFGVERIYVFTANLEYGVERDQIEERVRKQLRNDGLKAYETLIAHGVLGVEMETAALYTLCARFGARGLSVCTMTDSLVTGEALSADDRQTSLEEMVTLALDVAVDA